MEVKCKNSEINAVFQKECELQLSDTESDVNVIVGTEVDKWMERENTDIFEDVHGDDSDSIATDFDSFLESSPPYIASDAVEKLIDTIDVSSAGRSSSIEINRNDDMVYTKIKTRLSNDDQDYNEGNLETEESSTNFDESAIFYGSANQSVCTSPEKSCHEACLSNASTPKCIKFLSAKNLELPLLMEPNQGTETTKNQDDGKLDLEKSNDNTLDDIAVLSLKRKRKNLDLTPKRKSQRLLNKSVCVDSDDSVDNSKHFNSFAEKKVDILEANYSNQSDMENRDCFGTAVNKITTNEWNSIPLKEIELEHSEVNQQQMISGINEICNSKEIYPEITANGEHSAIIDDGKKEQEPKRDLAGEKDKQFTTPNNIEKEVHVEMNGQGDESASSSNEKDMDTDDAKNTENPSSKANEIDVNRGVIKRCFNKAKGSCAIM